MAVGQPQIGSNVASPYFAPWATQFNSYSTQQVTLKGQGTNTQTTTIPDAQWWRVPVASATMVTSSTVGNRLAYMEINPPGNALYEFGMTSTQAASLTGQYTWGIGLNAFATTAVGGNQVFQSPLVDVIWPPGTIFKMALLNPLLNDSFGPATVAAEIYTEYVATAAAGTSVLIPSPVLT